MRPASGSAGARHGRLAHNGAFHELLNYAMPRPLKRLLVLLLGSAALAGAAHAQGWTPSSFFVQAGGGEDRVRAASAGLRWDWDWRSSLLGAEVTGTTEVFVSNWRARDLAGGRENFIQLGVVPMFRFRPGAGQSPWFFEAGIGLSVTDERFVTANKTFSTRWNFSDNFAFGRNFGDKGQHELSLRWQHTSNGGVKKPNPGLDLLLVRYATRF